VPPGATVCVAGLQTTCDGVVTVKVKPALVTPLLVTATVRGPSAAPGSITNVVAMLVGLVTVVFVAATPLPLTAIVASGPKSVPMMTCRSVVPVAPSGCRSAVIAGAGFDAAVTLTLPAPAATDGDDGAVAEFAPVQLPVSNATDMMIRYLRHIQAAFGQGGASIQSVQPVPGLAPNLPYAEAQHRGRAFRLAPKMSRNYWVTLFALNLVAAALGRGWERILFVDALVVAVFGIAIVATRLWRW
jgi:hypothetical protein